MQRAVLRLAYSSLRRRVSLPSRVLIPSIGRLACPVSQSCRVYSCTTADNSITTTTAIHTNGEVTTTDIDYLTLSFYRFVEIPAITLEPLRQQLSRQLESIGVLGRIYVATEGINAQISCPPSSLPQLRELCDKYEILNGIEFNMSTEHRRAFRRLAIRIKRQIVSDGRSNSTYDLTKQPIYLDAETWHNELASGSPLLIDMRNHYESEIGYFNGAQRPDVDTFRDGLQEMERLAEQVPKDQPIYMYCTGGIRCSKAGAILRSQGWEDVRMLKGGITAYGRYIRENKGIKSLFRGKNFTFDKRLGESITGGEDEETVGRCHQCGTPCDHYTNCRNRRCNLLFIQCDTCRVTHSRTCGSPVCIEVEKAERETAAHVVADAANPPKNGKPCIHPHRDRVRPKEIMRQWPIVLEGYPERIRPRRVLDQLLSHNATN
ncbi:hypothetical protein BDF19DRAFT_419586 [Syncephalis fuscata]|nr:hypothetical protein BDF19DRAFT_419586 [Syncephalis fuscata]